MTDPTPLPPREELTVRLTRSTRNVLTAKLLVAANLGALLGYAIWRSTSKEAHEAQALTLAEYTARFASYRDHLMESGETPMLAYVLLCGIGAILAAGLYELLGRGLAFLLDRTGVGPAVAPWQRDRGA